jgi:MFS family permease
VLPPQWTGKLQLVLTLVFHRSLTLCLTVGSPIAGRLSDTVVRKWQARRKGVWYPEDRLRATWIGGLIMVPISIAASGLLTTYVGGPIGLSLNLLCLYMNGMGVGLSLLCIMLLTSFTGHLRREFGLFV